MGKRKRFFTVWLLALLFTLNVVAVGYMAYCLGLLSTVTAIAMLLMSVFAYELYNRLSKFQE